MNPRLRVDRLNKTYGSIRALRDVSLIVKEGEVLGLIGPNGAGKTTLFECIAGVLPAESGTIAAGDSAIDATTRGRYLFYLPDGIAPWPSQTVQWALDFSLGFYGGDRERRRAVVDQLELAPLLPRRIASLSKGQRKRALLGVALLTPQALLLIDEPFEGLDFKQTRRVADVLRAHSAGGRTLFLSIHQIAEAARCCDRFILLSGGTVCGAGTTEELIALAAARGAAASGLEEVFVALT